MIEFRGFSRVIQSPESPLDNGVQRVLQYRQQEEDWGGHNEDPDMVWSEWIDIPIDIPEVEEGA